MGNTTCARVVVTPRIVEFFVASELIVTISNFWFGDNSVGTVTNILTIINVLVYFAWQDAISILCTRNTDVSSSSDLAKWRFMYNNFRMPTNMEELAKRPHTILLSAFSHRSLGHLIGNMFSLQLVGRYVEEAASSSSPPRRRQFAYFYISSIYASKLIDIFVLKRLLGPKSKEFWRIPPSSSSSTTTTTTSGNQKNVQKIK